MDITNNIFEDNQAISGDENFAGEGGGVCLECTHKECAFNIKNNTFKRNKAVTNGGSVQWTGIMPTQENNSFEGNEAAYAPNIASFAVALAAVDDNGNLTTTTGGRVLADKEIENVTEIVSGTNLKDSGLKIKVALVDHFNNIVTTDSSSIGRLKTTNANVSLIGTTELVPVKGIYTFDDFTITAPPGTIYSITVESDGIDADKANSSADSNSDYSKSATINMGLRNCTKGETL